MNIKCLVIAAGFVLLGSSATFGQYAGWKHSGPLHRLTTPQGTDLPANTQIRHFPLLVRLDNDWFDFSQAQPKGQDVRFSTHDDKSIRDL